MFILNFVVRILAILILMFSSFTLELISHFGDELSWVLITRIVFHTGVVLLIFLLIKKYLLKYWSLKKSFISYLLFCILIISFINTQTYYVDKKIGIKQFNYPMANCFAWGRGFFTNSFSTNYYNTLLQFFPFTTRYIFLTAGDACRVFQIKYKINNSKTRELMCPRLSRIDCFKDIIKETSTNSIYTISGKILLIAVGAIYAFEEKEKYQIKEHPLVNEDIRERGEILKVLNSTASLFDILSLIENSLIADKGVSGLFKDFPNEEIKNIPAEIKSEVIRVLKEDIKKGDDAEMYKMAAGMETKYSKMAGEANSKVLDAYLLMLTDEELSEHLHKKSCSKIMELSKKISDKLQSDKYKKYLTAEECKSFDLKFKELNKRLGYCGKMR